MNVIFRPLETWPGEETENRQPSPFNTDWEKTLELIEYELGRLGAIAVVVKTFHAESSIRRDGWPKIGSRDPEHPGVRIEWQIGESWYGRQNDQYAKWSDNLRGLALTLQALRAVERWGAVQGEQFEGMRLEIEGPNSAMTGNLLTAQKILVDAADISREQAEAMGWDKVIRHALKNTHPDTADGNEQHFLDVLNAKEVLGL